MEAGWEWLRIVFGCGFGIIGVELSGSAARELVK